MQHESSKGYFCRKIDTIINQIKLSDHPSERQPYYRLTASINKDDYHITIPNHNPIKIGTINKILKDIADHNNISKEELIEKLF